jgi:hypothetical protein
VRFGNTALSAPHVTAEVDLLATVEVVGLALGFTVVAVDLVELGVSLVVVGDPESRDEVGPGTETDGSEAGDVEVESMAAVVPQADKRPSPTRARQEIRGFCIPLLHTIYSPQWGIPAIPTGGQVVALAVSTVEC